MILSNLNGGRLLILMNLFHILFSPAEKKHAYRHLCRCSASCTNYNLAACMVMSRANRTATHNGTAFLGYKVGREIWLYQPRKNVCLFWRLYLCLCGRLCAHTFLSVFNWAYVRVQVLLVWLWQLILAVSHRTYSNNCYANRSLTQIRHIFHFHSSAVTGYTVTLLHWAQWLRPPAS